MAQGGGANSFAWNFARFLKEQDISLTSYLLRASHAIVVANHVNVLLLRLARGRGCRVLHRLDEDFAVPTLSPKHEKILKVNLLADFTVFQSQFVKDNLLTHLRTTQWDVVLNGADPAIFRYQGEHGKYIGHITNSVGSKKRLDLLERAISRYSDESFMLVGNHRKSEIDFGQYDNVTMIGPIDKLELAHYHRSMKCLYFPSERDPCPNTVAEAILSGVPVCYNSCGGTKELVRDCGVPLNRFDELLADSVPYRTKCLDREDLHFDEVASKYLALLDIEHD